MPTDINESKAPYSSRRLWHTFSAQDITVELFRNTRDVPFLIKTLFYAADNGSDRTLEFFIDVGSFEIYLAGKTAVTAQEGSEIHPDAVINPGEKLLVSSQQGVSTISYYIGMFGVYLEGQYY